MGGWVGVARATESSCGVLLLSLQQNLPLFIFMYLFIYLCTSVLIYLFTYLFHTESSYGGAGPSCRYRLLDVGGWLGWMKGFVRVVEILR